MGKAKQYEGVRARGSSIQIDFRYNGERCRETIPIEPSPSNLKNASNLRGEILNKITLGLFDYAQYFPNSERAKKLASQQPLQPIPTTFSEYSELYLGSLELEKGTKAQYTIQLRNKWIPLIGDRDISTIRYSEITAIIGGIAWSSAKHRNNCLIPLRAVFEMAYMDDVIPSNPLDKVKNQKQQKVLPDPLSVEEANAIIDYMHTHYNEQVANYFEFAFYSGLRIEELIALQWGDYDRNDEVIRVQRARAYREIKSTKTNKVRDVKLSPRAKAAIERQKRHTFFRDDGLIFVNPETGNEWADNHKAQRMRYWQPALRKLGVRFRHQKQTRHTYATMLLMAGVNYAYAAQQMGHSVQVFLSVYSKWLNIPGQTKEMDKLNVFLGYGHKMVTSTSDSSISH